MANIEHLKILENGLAAWNGWYEKNSSIKPDFSDADLTGKDLKGYILTYSNLKGAKLSNANLSGSDLSHCDLTNANLNEANLGPEYGSTNLQKANLSGAFLGWSNLIKADLSGANLTDANLIGAHLIETDLTGAILTGCNIYGISAWNLKVDGSIQFNLVITPPNESEITVDNLEVAQFIYLMINNQKIKNIIETITTKAVLILGRFSSERKVILDLLKDELRNRGYLPILFDFDKPTNRSLTETVTLLARMSRFIIADISDPKSVPQELYAIVPTLRSVPVQLILDRSSRAYPMVVDIMDNPQVLEKIFLYDNLTELLESMREKIIVPVELKAKEMDERRKRVEDEFKKGDNIVG